MLCCVNFCIIINSDLLKCTAGLVSAAAEHLDIDLGPLLRLSLCRYRQLLGVNPLGVVPFCLGQD